MRELAATVMQGRDVEISPESRRHLEECEKCREFFPLWVEKSKAAYNDQQYARVIEEPDRGDSAILRKTVKQGLALFKPGVDGKPDRKQAYLAHQQRNWRQFEIARNRVGSSFAVAPNR